MRSASSVCIILYSCLCRIAQPSQQFQQYHCLFCVVALFFFPSSRRVTMCCLSVCHHIHYMPITCVTRLSATQRINVHFSNWSFFSSTFAIRRPSFVPSGSIFHVFQPRGSVFFRKLKEKKKQPSVLVVILLSFFTSRMESVRWCHRRGPISSKRSVCVVRWISLFSCAYASFYVLGYYYSNVSSGNFVCWGGSKFAHVFRKYKLYFIVRH